MQTVAIRELNHHMSKYFKMVKAGQRLVVTDHNIPVADIIPHNPDALQPSWKKPFKKIKLKSGELASETIIRMRQEDWR